MCVDRILGGSVSTIGGNYLSSINKEQIFDSN